LEQRRRLLVAQSSDLRSQIADDFTRVRSWTTWIDAGWMVIRSVSSLWPIAGLGALLFKSKSGGALSKAGKWLSWLRLAFRIRRLFSSSAERKI